MKKIKLWVDTGFACAVHEEIIEVDDDYSHEELDEDAQEYMFECIEYGWCEVDEEDIW